jgi:hypothetical protein
MSRASPPSLKFTSATQPVQAKVVPRPIPFVRILMMVTCSQGPSRGPLHYNQFIHEKNNQTMFPHDFSSFYKLYITIFFSTITSQNKLPQKRRKSVLPLSKPLPLLSLDST